MQSDYHWLVRTGEAAPQFFALVASTGTLDTVLHAAQARPQDDQLQQALALVPAVVGSLVEAAKDRDAGEAASDEQAAELDAAVQNWLADSSRSIAQHNAASWLPPFRHLAAALLAWWRRPEAQSAAALELAQAAAARSCAYLRCANLGGEGGPAAGRGAGSQRCRWAGAIGWAGDGVGWLS